ncbi:hypothetical protein VI817_001807 [Penicillium citrinum]|nr:hypothetical protein VI817_001807 [Penicillium citrinum]
MSNTEVDTDNINAGKWESGESYTGSSNDETQKHNGDIEDFADRNLAQVNTVNTVSTYYSPFAGGLQPGLYRPGPVERRKIANPAPLGLCGFALTTFVLGCINMEVRGIAQPNIFVASALAYGGLIQLLSGMWYGTLLIAMLESNTDGYGREMGVGNTFGATALSSYGGFWIAMAITFTPGGFDIEGQLEKADGGSPAMFYDSLGIFLMVS